MWLVTTVAITAVAIAFGRFRSNERVALAVALGAIRRRGEAAVASPSIDKNPPTQESSPT